MEKKTTFVTLLITTALALTACTPVGSSAGDPSSGPSESASASPSAEDASLAICSVVRDLRMGWFEGKDMEDFTEHIPELEELLTEEVVEEGGAVVATAAVLLLDLEVIAAGMKVAPTTKEESDSFLQAIDRFPTYSQAVIGQCDDSN